MRPPTCTVAGSFEEASVEYCIPQYIKMSTYEDSSCTTFKSFIYYQQEICILLGSSGAGSLFADGSGLSVFAEGNMDCSGTAIHVVSGGIGACDSTFKMKIDEFSVSRTNALHWASGLEKFKYKGIDLTSSSCLWAESRVEHEPFNVCQVKSGMQVGISFQSYKNTTCVGSTKFKRTYYSNSACSTVSTASATYTLSPSSCTVANHGSTSYCRGF